ERNIESMMRCTPVQWLGESTPDGIEKALPEVPGAMLVCILPMLEVAFSVYHMLLGSPDGPAVIPSGCELGGTTPNSLIVAAGMLNRPIWSTAMLFSVK